MNTHDKFFRKYLQDNIDMWLKTQELKWDIQDIIEFSSFLLIDSNSIKKQNEMKKEWRIYWMGVLEFTKELNDIKRKISNI